jgi:hypothetical protein
MAPRVPKYVGDSYLYYFKNKERQEREKNAAAHGDDNRQ